MKKIVDIRPWGKFEQFTLNEISTVKIITVTAGEKLSLQYHKNREEFWKIISGRGFATVGEEKIEVFDDKEIFIPKETNHRIEAIEEIKFLEIAFGEFDENDIVRLDDKYNRK